MSESEWPTVNTSSCLGYKSHASLTPRFPSSVALSSAKISERAGQRIGLAGHYGADACQVGTLGLALQLAHAAHLAAISLLERADSLAGARQHPDLLEVNALLPLLLSR